MEFGTLMLLNMKNKKEIIRENCLRILFSHPSLCRLFNQRGHAVYFLTYHSISTSSPAIPADLGLCVSPEEFENHMKYISTYCNPLSLFEAEEILSGKKEPIKNAVTVTFDDGYRDNLTNALPVLKKYRVPATIFLITGIVGTGKRPWLINLYFDIFQSQQSEISFEIPHSDQKHKFYLRNKAEKYALMLSLRFILKNLRGADRKSTIYIITEQLKKDHQTLHLDHLKMLSWDDVVFLKKEGIAFGSHSVNHLILDNEDDETLFTEVTASKKTIEGHIGSEVTAFAYPGNSGSGFSPRTEKSIIEAGYTSAYLFSTGTGFNVPGCNMFRLNRGEVLGSQWELAGEISTILPCLRGLKNHLTL